MEATGHAGTVSRTTTSKQGGFKTSQRVVVGVSKVKNNLHHTEEDSIVHRCALHNKCHHLLHCTAHDEQNWPRHGQNNPVSAALLDRSVPLFFHLTSGPESVPEEGRTSVLITYVQETIKSGFIILRIVMKRGKHSDKSRMDVWC